MTRETWFYIFYSDLGGTLNNAALLAFRILLCFQMLRVHGLKKIGDGGGGASRAEIVPNPLGLPPRLNQLIAVFSDTVAPILIAFGLATRLAAVPILAVTLTGYFVVHRHDSASVRDVPFMYSLCYLFVLLVGAGEFSVDFYFSNSLVSAR